MTLLDLDRGADVSAAASPTPQREPVGRSSQTNAVDAEVNPFVTALAVFLAVAAAGWMVGGVFGGVFPRLVGVLGAAIGAGATALSFKTSRPSVVQYGGIVAGVCAGIVLVLPDARGGSGNLPGLIAEALRGGGLATPPVPFDPGWRFLLVVVMTAMAGGASALSIALRRPKLGIFLPIPIVFAAALVQPHATPVVLTAVGVVLIPAAITVSHGVDLAREGSTSGRFELRRLSRSVGILAALLAGLVILGQLGLLGGETDDNQVIPPQRPQAPPPQADRVLFKVESPRQVPWRLGVLDVYDGRGWLLPSYDPARLVPLPGGLGAVPNSREPGGALPRLASRETFSARFTISDVPGRAVPTIAGATAVEHGRARVDFDPRTQTLRLAGRARAGTTYRVTAVVPSGASELGSAPAVPKAMAPYLEMPTAPPAVQALLAAAPGALYDRLQYVRTAFYQHVVAAGSGRPVDVSPARVVSMLEGRQASPFEITAGEAMLVRWAGLPARIGFGYYGGARPSADSNILEVRPRNGASWVEVYFEGHGWIPFIGTPPKARASLSENDKQQNPDVRPSANLALSTYVPVRTQSVKLFFEVARYWAMRVVPILLLAGLALWLYPGAVKLARRARRRRFADAGGVLPRIVVAYAEFRDVANDLNIGDATRTPLEFLDAIDDDAEHRELAWLVTRCVWGDLHRDVSNEDAERAVDLAASVTKRLRRAQTPSARVLSFTSRISLREPHTPDIPNLWIARRGDRRGMRALFRRGLRLRLAAPVALALVAMLAGASFTSCSPSRSRPAAMRPLPSPVAPSSVLGVAFQREPKMERAFQRAGSQALVDSGVVYSLRSGAEVLGSLQVARFRANTVQTDADIDDVRNGVTAGLGHGTFKPVRVGRDVLLEQRLSEQRLVLWFAPDMAYYELLVTAASYEDAPKLLAATLAFARGESLTVDDATVSRADDLDPRRGGVQ